MNGNGYNMTYGGDGTNGYVWTQEDKQKMSESMKTYFFLSIFYIFSLHVCMILYSIVTNDFRFCTNPVLEVGCWQLSIHSQY